MTEAKKIYDAIVNRANGTGICLHINNCLRCVKADIQCKIQSSCEFYINVENYGTK